MNTALMDCPVEEVDRVEKLKRYWYEPGCVRWLLIPDGVSPKSHRTSKGWRVDLVEMDYHPVTFNKLQNPQTWVRETYVGVTA